MDALSPWQKNAVVIALLLFAVSEGLQRHFAWAGLVAIASFVFLYDQHRRKRKTKP
jgi:hypothetical protein